MDDLISRQAAIDALERIFDRCEEIEAHLPEGDPDRDGYKMYPDYLTVWKYLHQLPSAETEEFEWCHDCKEYDQEQHCCHRWTKVIRETVEELKQAQQEQQWIPCSERLPGKNCRCLTTKEALGSFKVDWNVWLDETIDKVNRMDDLISRLSEIRSEYNCFDENEEPYYRALSEAITILSRRADGDTISRRAAIDFVDAWHLCHPDELRWRDNDVVNFLKSRPPAQPEPVNSLTKSDMISKQKVRSKLTALVNEIEEIFANIREREVDECVCGLCEYDGAYIGQSGGWCNECPGFEKDNCFKLKDEYRAEWESIDG